MQPGGGNDRVRAYHAHSVADQEFGVAAVTGGEATAEHILLVSVGIEDARRREILDRLA
jgi:hypothetical protein